MLGLWGATASGVNEDLEYAVDASVDLPTASKEAYQKWRDNRFGMFIHWGPISQMGVPLSHARNSLSHRTGGAPYKVSTVSPEVYDVQYKTFNPVEFDSDEVMKLAKRAGIRYVVFTAKHHAGFSMFDSAVSEYDIMSAPYKKDIVGQLAESARDNGLQFGFYYSPRDWSHPDCDSDNHHDRYISFYKEQMKELLGNYGSIYEIWFDGLGPGEWGNTSSEVMTMIRALHPDALVNDRGGAGADFYTPEHTISYYNSDTLWEACHPTTGQWGYNPDLTAKSLEQLMEILLYVWGGDGNMLLNIGPMGNGAMNPLEVERLEQIADWWGVHGEESIRKSRGGPYLPGPWGVATRKDKRVFLHVFRWPEQGGLQFPALENLRLKSARTLSGSAVEATANKNGLRVDVPKSGRGKILTTIELTFDGETLPAKPLPRVASLTGTAKLIASHHPDLLKNLTDRDASTNWEASLQKGENEFWVEASFDEPVSIACFNIARGEEWVPKHTAELQVPDGSKGWKTVTPEDFRLRWETMKFLDETVTTDRIRLRITNTKKFAFTELELFPPVN